MDQNQYNETASADPAILTVISRSQATKLKRGYGAASSVAYRFLKANGLIATDRMIPSAKKLADAILRYKRKPYLDLGKNPSKALVVSFAQEVGGATGEVIALKSPRKRKAQPAAPLSPKPSPDFYWSDEWRRVRYVALRASRGVCELCGTAPAPGAPLHVDHIKPRSKFPELELDPTNLQVLCKDCNLGKGNIDAIDWRRQAG